MDLETKVRIQEQIIKNLTLALEALVNYSERNPFAERLLNQADSALDKAKMAQDCFAGKAEMREFANVQDAVDFALPLEGREHEFLEMPGSWIVFSRQVGYTQLSLNG